MSVTLKQLLVCMISVILLTACSGTPPKNIGVNDKRLAPCPSSPNCVGSFEAETDEEHYLKPFSIDSSPENAWQALTSAVKQNRSAKIISMQDTYIRAEYTSTFFRFVDDVEFFLIPEQRTVHLRSASRLGRSDFGVNRKRLEKLRVDLSFK
jgi:uncharacterized protein (DUF1499 family)